MTPSGHYLLKIIPTRGYRFHSNGSCSTDSTIDWIGTEICVIKCPQEKHLSKIRFGIDIGEDIYLEEIERQV